MLREDTNLGDMRLNRKVLLNAQHSCGCFSHGREEVRRLLVEVESIPNGGATATVSVKGTGSCLVWLAGHSLGASIALDVGRDIMANRELNIPTFLFNPPHVSLAAVIHDKVPMAKLLKKFLHASSFTVKHGLGKVLKSHRENMEEQFEQLSPWMPNIYVHERDIICRGFIDYFEQRELVKQWSNDRVAASGTTLSYRDMCRYVFSGRKKKEQPHLLPSAVLWKNKSSDGNRTSSGSGGNPRGRCWS